MLHFARILVILLSLASFSFAGPISVYQAMKGGKVKRHYSGSLHPLGQALYSYDRKLDIKFTK